MTIDPHAADAPGHEEAVAHHAREDHGEDSGHDDHGHAEEPLGPIDMWAWGAGALGVLLGLATVACFMLATGVVTVA